jgi:hypothetical protein
MKSVSLCAPGAPGPLQTEARNLALKIIGTGFGRKGTGSLKLAQTPAEYPFP